MNENVKVRFEKALNGVIDAENQRICPRCQKSIADKINTVSDKYIIFKCRSKKCRGVEHVKVR